MDILDSFPILYDGGVNFYFFSQLYDPGPGILSVPRVYDLLETIENPFLEVLKSLSDS